MRLVLAMALMSIAVLPGKAQSGRTFYIDHANGSNGNNGSKSSPWKTHPFMQAGSACTGSGAAPNYSHAAGDSFIFKGGVTWPAACFGMNVSVGGSSAANDYYGVDQTWFDGASWSRPVFDLANSIPTAAGDMGGNNVVWVGGGNVTFDNIEIKRQGIVGGHSGPNMGYDCAIYFHATTGNIVKNGFFHDWVASTSAINAGWSNCAGGIGQANGSYTADNMTISGQNAMDITRNVQLSFGGCFGSAKEVKNSRCLYAGQGVLGYVSVHDSEFANMSNAGAVSPYTNAIHTNVIEQTYPGGAGDVYNNLIHDNNIGVVILACSNANIYNNVIWHGNVPLIQIDTNCGNDSNNTANVYNNTSDCSNGVQCFRVVNRGTTLGTLNLKNNQWITNGTAICYNNTGGGCSNVGTANVSNNSTISVSTATAQGYTYLNLYEPTASDTLTIALNLSNLCSGGLTALCADRVHVPRLTSWMAGAYVFGGQTTKPAPPTSLNATVQ